MIEEVEYKGEWWLPSDPNNRLSGTLRFNQDEGAILELGGCFTTDFSKDELLNPTIVNGTSYGGVDITLCHCLEQGFNIYSGGHSNSWLYAHQVFEGVHFQEQGDIKFKNLIVRFAYLDRWLNISGFDTKQEGEQIVIKFKSPNSIHAMISPGLYLSIDFGYTYSPYILTEVDLKQNTHIVLLPPDDKHFEEYRDIIHHFRNFLSLATMESVYPSSIEGEADIESYKKVVGNTVLYPRVKIFYQLARSPKIIKKTRRFQPLFTFELISKDFERYLQNWFGKEELLKPVHQLYFGLLYNPDMYLDQKFLCFVQALEAYHRRTMGNWEIPEEKHQERIAGIIDSVPQEHRAWLSCELEYSNEPNLRRRLKELLKAHSAVMPQLIGDGRRFVDKVCTTRNYLIHYDSILENRAAKEGELLKVTNGLRVLIEACLLKELGFSSEDVGKLLSTYYAREM